MPEWPKQNTRVSLRVRNVHVLLIINNTQCIDYMVYICVCTAVDLDEVEAVEAGCQSKVAGAIKLFGAEVSKETPSVEASR